MTFDEIMRPGFPHGTPAGYEQGCRTAAACPAHHAYGLSCKLAQREARSDWAVKKLYRDGFSPEQVSVYISDGIVPTEPLPTRDLNAPTTPTGIDASAPTPGKEKPMKNPTPGRKPAAKRPPRKQTPKPPRTKVPAVSTAQIRAWAIAEGYVVPRTGPLQAMIVEKYNDAHRTPVPGPAVEAYPPDTPEQAAAARAAGQTIALGEPTVEDYVRATGEGVGLSPEQQADALATIAERSDMLDETRRRIADNDEPPTAVPATAPRPDTDAPDALAAAASDDGVEWGCDDEHPDLPYFCVRPVDHPHDHVATNGFDILAVWPRQARPEWGDVAAAADVERARSIAVRLEQELAHAEGRAITAERALVLALEKWDELKTRDLTDLVHHFMRIPHGTIAIAAGSISTPQTDRFRRAILDRRLTHATPLVEHVEPRRGADIDLAWFDEVTDFAGIHVAPFQRAVFAEWQATNPTIARTDVVPVDVQRPSRWRRFLAWFGLVED